MSDFSAAAGRQGATRFAPAGRRMTALMPARIALAGVSVATLALRLAIIFRYRIDSDETQHLHVTWGWTRGLLQYRDFFDNHMPLFQVLSIPLVWLAGERPSALVIDRMAMLPLFVAMALLASRIGVSCYPRREAITATFIGILAPDFFLCSVEFRPDNLWAVCWLASLAILVSAPVTPRRAAAAGLALGLAASVSAKTSLLASVLAIAAIVAVAVTQDASMRLGALAKRAMIFSGAAILPPLIVAGYFAARGAWAPFLYCTVTHNLVASEHPRRLLLLPLFVVLAALGTRRIRRDESVTLDVRRRRILLFVATYGYERRADIGLADHRGGALAAVLSARCCGWARIVAGEGGCAAARRRGTHNRTDLHPSSQCAMARPGQVLDSSHRTDDETDRAGRNRDGFQRRDALPATRVLLRPGEDHEESDCGRTDPGHDRRRHSSDSRDGRRA